MDVMQRPGEFFGSLNPEAGFARPLIFYLVFVILGSGASTLTGLAMGGESFAGPVALPGFEGLSMTALLWFNFFLAPFAALLGLAIGVGLTHVGVLMFVRDRKPVGVTAKVLCYAAAPAVLGIIPLLGWIVSGVWAIFLQIVGIQVAHETSPGRAAAAVLIPPIALIAGVFLLALLLAFVVAVSVGGAV
jgi:hypothetical protein